MPVSRRFYPIELSFSAMLGAIPLLCLTAMLTAAPAAFSAPPRASYVVVLKDDVAHPAYLAHRHERNRGAEITHVYGVAIKGYSAMLTRNELKAIKQDPNVDYAESDGVIEPYGQAVGNQLKRVYANLSNLKINESDVPPTDRVNADIAILDTGVYAHPDLNIVSRVNCVGGGGGCKPGQPDDDTAGHGTHVAGDAAAIDNGIGAVGTAPGARIWSVKVVSRMGHIGSDEVGMSVNGLIGDPALDLKEGNAQMSDAIAGINWVTIHSSEIEVANMSFACATDQGGCARTALKEAIATSVNSGVVWVAAAGQEGMGVNNNQYNIKHYPALLSDVITVSAMADYDGLPGSLSNPNACPHEKGEHDDRLMGAATGINADDEFATLGSNYGPEVDITAPGSCIFSTWSPNVNFNSYDIPYGSTYGFMNGSSVASALVAGAAADIAAQSNPNSRADVENIKAALIAGGNYNWEDLGNEPQAVSPDGVKEPLLDMHNLLAPLPPSCVSHSAPTATETSPTPFRAANGEFNVFARATSGEQISFGRTNAGAWSVFNETAVLPCHPLVQSSQSVLQTANGEILVFARNTDNELVQFGRTPAGAWSEYNLTSMVAGQPHVAGDPLAVITSLGELAVFIRTTNNELISFNRTSGGAWFVHNETAVVPGHPTILSSPSFYDWGGGNLTVFARSNNNELIGFNRTGAGAWSIANVTAVTPGNPKIVDSPAAMMSNVGSQLLVFGRTANNELISFLREPSGVWSIYNETAVVPGHPTILGAPEPVITSANELSVFARTTNNELISFNRTTGGAWSVYNETAVVPGNPKILELAQLLRLGRRQPQRLRPHHEQRTDQLQPHRGRRLVGLQRDRCRPRQPAYRINRGRKSHPGGRRFESA